MDLKPRELLTHFTDHTIKSHFVWALRLEQNYKTSKSMLLLSKIQNNLNSSISEHTKPWYIQNLLNCIVAFYQIAELTLEKMTSLYCNQLKYFFENNISIFSFTEYIFIRIHCRIYSKYAFLYWIKLNEGRAFLYIIDKLSCTDLYTF